MKSPLEARICAVKRSHSVVHLLFLSRGQVVLTLKQDLDALIVCFLQPCTGLGLRHFRQDDHLKRWS